VTTTLIETKYLLSGKIAISGHYILPRNDMSKILLLNYTSQEADSVSSDLSIEVHRGYISRSKTFRINNKGVSIPNIDFYIPESFAEYKAIFINFDIPDGIIDEFEGKISDNYEAKGKKFLSDYWFNDRGYLVIFTGKDLVNLESLGVPLNASEALNTDTTVWFGINLNKSNTFRVALAKQIKNICMPSSHYISSVIDEDFKKYLDDGHLDKVYTNSSSRAVGVYIDSKQDEHDYGNDDAPQVMVLPQFKSISKITAELTRIFATLSPRFLTLSNSDWASSYDYFPDSIKEYQEKIKQVEVLAKKKVSELTSSMVNETEHNSAYLGILNQTGDTLVESTQWLLVNVLDLNVVDVDKEEGAGARKEDLLITMDNGEKILAEVKGTKSENPSPKYIGQATNHFIRKSKLGAKKCILIINHDYEKEPKARKKAYTGGDSELLDSVDYVSYLDTRILHKICLAVANGTLSKKSAVEIITAEGRIEFKK